MDTGSYMDQEAGRGTEIRINTPLDEVYWLNHHITEEIFQTEHEMSKPWVKFWTCEAKFTSRFLLV